MSQKPVMLGTYGTMYYVRDMAKSVAFYKERFGLSGNESPEWSEFDLNGHAICLHAMRPGEKHSSEGVLITKVKGIKGVISELRSQGVEVENEHEVYPGAFAANFRTPDGHTISLYEDTNRG